MKLLRYAAILMILLATQAWAQGNVLLPSDNSTGAPNLGLTPSLPESPPPEEKKPAPLPEKPQTPAPTPTPIPAPTPAAPIQQRPQPKFQPPAPMAQHPIQISITPATWSPNDITQISSQLGLPLNEVASQCQLGFNGSVMTDQGTFPIESNMTATANTAYSGNISSTSLSIYAACAAAPKPQPYAYIEKMGSRFAIPFSSTFCSQPPQGMIYRINVMRSANSGNTCTYQ